MIMDTLSSSVNYHFVASDNVSLVFDHYLMICLTFYHISTMALRLVAERSDGSEVGNRMNTSCIMAGNNKILSPSDALFISHLFPSSHMTRMND